MCNMHFCKQTVTGFFILVGKFRSVLFGIYNKYIFFCEKTSKSTYIKYETLKSKYEKKYPAFKGIVLPNMKIE